MKQLLLIPVLLLASACGDKRLLSTPEPIVVIKEVQVPIVGACVPQGLGPAPAYFDTDEALRLAKNAAVRYQLVTAGRGQRIARLREVEPIVAGCPRAK